MISLFYGTDTVAVRQAAFKLVDEKADAGVEIGLIEGDNFEAGLLEDAAGASSLFGGSSIYVLDTPSSDKSFAEGVKKVLPVLAESGTDFVVIEAAILAADKKLWSKYATTINEFKAETKERFNTFAMADALARKDKKSLWILLQEAKSAGQSAEEIIGVLWWQLKTLRVASMTSSASEAGLKDFPYNKAKRALSKFKTGETEALSRSLLTVYQDGHGGITDIGEGLEKWLLTL